MTFYFQKFFIRVSKIAKSDVGFVVFVCTSLEKLGSQLTDFYKIWYLTIFPKSVEKVQVSLKSGRNKECFT